MSAVSWHHELAQAAPAAALGTLRWQVSKMAFDALKVVVLFFLKNLIMAAWHQARYGQLRAPLVEQRVPDDAQAVVAALDQSVPDVEVAAAVATGQPGVK
jgi:hypothetical protein